MSAKVTRWALRNAPWILLVAVALSQIYLARVVQLINPSKGGGFGLFSTVDKLENRLFRAYLIGRGTETPVLAESRADLAAIRRAQALPTDFNLRAVGQTMLSKDYPAAVEGIRVEIWKQTFVSSTREVRRIKVRELMVPRINGHAN